jgi:succinoglycan biosynthesis transport protein ExoP
MRSPGSATPAEQTGMVAVREYALIASRNKWVIAGAITLSLTLALGYYLLATKYYQSQTMIVAEEHGAINNVINKDGDAGGSFEQRLFLIQRQIINKNFMDEVAKEFSLFPSELNQEEQRDALFRILDMTRVERVKMDPAVALSSQSLV